MPNLQLLRYLQNIQSKETSQRCIAVLCRQQTQKRRLQHGASVPVWKQENGSNSVVHRRGSLSEDAVM